MRKLAGISVALLALTSWGAPAQGHETLTPNQTFRFKPNAYGCLSKDELDTAYQHARTGDTARSQALFNWYQCMATPEHAEFRVIRVIGDDVEFQNRENHDPDGMWTRDQFILR